ncbi:hypothetical protein ABE10_01185, partial [Bacillus toyonensis]|nr:hypothetical protein [Bacillus toyonensis]
AVSRLVPGADAGDAGLVLVHPGAPVALDEDRTVGADDDVPSDVLHLRHHAGNLVDERLDLVDQGELEVRDPEAGVRVGLVHMAVRVVPGADGMAVVVEHRVEAAERHLVAHLAASELLRDGEDMGLLAIEEGGDARRVDRSGADRCEIWMLNDDLLDEEPTTLEEVAVELLPVGDVRSVVAEDAGAGLPHRRLHDHGSLTFDEGAQLVDVAGLDDHPFATQELAEGPVELDLVVEQVPVVRVRVALGDLVRHRMRHVRGAFGATEDREVVVDVVLEAHVVEGCRP